MNLKLGIIALAAAAWMSSTAQAQSSSPSTPSDTTGTMDSSADSSGSTMGSSSQTPTTPESSGTSMSGDQSMTSPMDQSNTSQDMNLTQQIRRSLTDNKSLSTSAKNVKIITMNGKVTLRGEVASQSEKDRIVSIATRAAGSGNVTDDLTIRPSGSGSTSPESGTTDSPSSY